jgi:transcription elongation GreA/GreB family factor
MQAIKQHLYKQLEQLVNERLYIAQENILSANDSQANDSKSTAGDKHETGRAMLHMEQENNQKQLAKALDLKKELTTIDITAKRIIIGKGSLVKTAQVSYFITIGLGKLVSNNEVVYAISLASPIGQLLLGKKAGDSFVFQGKEVFIIDIL